MGLIAPSKQAFIACALRLSGTTARISLALRIWRADIERARVGTWEMSANHASPTCWRRQASSRLTMMYGSSVVKSAGGSLKAMCPFSPMPEECNIDRRRRELLTDLASNYRGIGCVAFEKMIVRNSSLGYELLYQHFAKTAGMSDRQADVFVKVESLDFLPINAGCFCQRVQEFELGSGGRSDDAGSATLSDGVTNRSSGLLGGCVAERELVFENFEKHRRL